MHIAVLPLHSSHCRRSNSIPIGMLHLSVLAALAIAICPTIRAQSAASVCLRPQPGSVVPEPEDLRSVNGVLEASLDAQNALQPDGSVRYCFTDGAGKRLPTCASPPAISSFFT